MIVIRDPKTFCFISLIKNEIKQLMLQHKHQNNIHQHRKQQNK